MGSPRPGAASDASAISAAENRVYQLPTFNGPVKHVYCRVYEMQILTAPYLTLPYIRGGQACPALRPYQFGPMRNPDVTEGHSNRRLVNNYATVHVTRA